MHRIHAPLCSSLSRRARPAPDNEHSAAGLRLASPATAATASRRQRSCIASPLPAPTTRYTLLLLLLSPCYFKQLLSDDRHRRPNVKHSWVERGGRLRAPAAVPAIAPGTVVPLASSKWPWLTRNAVRRRPTRRECRATTMMRRRSGRSGRWRGTTSSARTAVTASRRACGPTRAPTRPDPLGALTTTPPCCAQ